MPAFLRAAAITCPTVIVLLRRAYALISRVRDGRIEGKSPLPDRIQPMATRTHPARHSWDATPPPTPPPSRASPSKRLRALRHNPLEPSSSIGSFASDHRSTWS